MDLYPADFGHEDDIDFSTAKRVAQTHNGPGASLRCDGTPEGSKADNNLRAAWGMVALAPYVDRTFGGSDEPFDITIPDLMSDLLHLCDAVGVDTDYALSKAARQYEEEVRGEL